MKHCKKIKLDFYMPWLQGTTPVFDKRFNRIVNKTSKHGNGIGELGVSRIYIPKMFIKLIKQALPEQLQDKILGASFSEISSISPHVHLIEKCVINVYIKVNGETTYFWDGEQIRDDTLTSDNGNGYLALQMDKLTKTESFTALDGDAWILNTQIPHSVSFEDMNYITTDTTKRLVVQVFMSATFEEVSSHFID